MSQSIPRRLVQIWGGRAALPELGRASAANVRLLNPGFEYCFYDDERIASFVSENFPQYSSVFESFRFPIQKYDFLRYLIIYRYGGFYFDLDVLLTAPISALTELGCVLPFERLSWTDYFKVRHGVDWEVGNYAFGAAPGHPFVGAVIRNCIRSQEDPKWLDELLRTIPWLLRDDLYVIYSTGPGLVTRTLLEYADAGDPVEVLFPPGSVADRKAWNRFGGYGIHLMQANWRKPMGPFRRRLLSLRGRRVENRAIDSARKDEQLGRTMPSGYGIRNPGWRSRGTEWTATTSLGS